MPNPQYRSGDYHEKRVADDLLDNGYLVRQVRGSKGAFDLIALKYGPQVLLVQVKASLVVAGTETMTGNDWNALYTIATRVGAVPLIAQRTSRGHIGYRQIIGHHEMRSHTWPARPWTPDDVELAAAIARRRGDG
jgi:Holliday junction resolvase